MQLLQTLQLVKTPITGYQGFLESPRSIWLKDETCQVSGAFKIRGVLNYVEKRQPRSSLVTASTGNHGLAVSITAAAYGLTAHIFIPASTSSTKKRKLLECNARITLVDGVYDDCEKAARHFALTQQFQYIHSFEESEIIEGHRSIFQEIEERVAGNKDLFVPVGGGGLLSACLQQYPAYPGKSAERQDIKIYAVEYEKAPVLKRALEEQRITRVQITPDTVEGLMVSEIGLKCFLACQDRQVDVILVSKEELEEAVYLLWTHNGIKAELAGAASFAAALKRGGHKNAVCILSGGNIDENYFLSIVNRYK